MSGLKYCPNCGKELESYVKICDYCGTKIEEKYRRIILRNPREAEKEAGFCLLCLWICLGIPVMILSFIGLIDYYNKLGDPNTVLSGDFLGVQIYIIVAIIPIIYCFIPGILLYLRGRKEEKIT